MGKKTKVPKGKPGPVIPLEKHEIEEYIIKANGNYSAAAKMVHEDLKIPMSRQKFTRWINSLGAEWMPGELRKSMVKSCIDTVLHKGLSKKDNQCLFKIIDKMGKCLNIEDPAQKIDVNHSLAAAFEGYDGKDLKKMRDNE